MDYFYLEVEDFSGTTQRRPTNEVVKVYLSVKPDQRVWVRFQPGLQIVEAKNADEVLEWGRSTKKLEDF